MKYTPYDLHRMREAIAQSEYGRTYHNADKQPVEAFLLTYMMNETTPEELEQYAKEKNEERIRESEWVIAEAGMRQRLCSHAFKKVGNISPYLHCNKCGLCKELERSTDAEPVVSEEPKKKRFIR